MALTSISILDTFRDSCWPAEIVEMLLRRRDTAPTDDWDVSDHLRKTVAASPACRDRFAQLVSDAAEQGRLIDEESAFRMGVVTGLLMSEVRTFLEVECKLEVPILTAPRKADILAAVNKAMAAVNYIGVIVEALKVTNIDVLVDDAAGVDLNDLPF